MKSRTFIWFGIILLAVATAAGATSAVHADSQGQHNCVLTDSGELRCWGDNSQRQIGLITSGPVISSLPVFGLLDDVDQVTTGWLHTCALLVDGRVQCWGSNYDGELGRGTVGGNSETVALVNNLSGASQISAGTHYNCALKTNGEIHCWGENNKGELGRGSTSANGSTPAAVIGLASAAIQVSTGSDHVCALLSDGTVQCWGDNSVGQLGIGSTGSPQPSAGIAVNLGLTALQVSTGEHHSCALLADTTVKCWGHNNVSQLGDTTTSNRSSPVLVSGLSGVTRIRTGMDHTCALISGGLVKCWGTGNSGQIGDGARLRRSAPVSVINLDNPISQIYAGHKHTCALSAAGGVKCWGDNAAGALGTNISGGGIWPTPGDVYQLTSGVCALADNPCIPSVPDSDGDGLTDDVDPDDDNDGVLDGDDAFPLDPTETADSDGDGTGDNADTDDDNDGVLDVDDAFPLDPTETADSDGDGTGDNADTDDDNDGVLDVDDAFPLDPTRAVFCPAGQYGALSCQDAPAGTYAPTAGLLEAALCELGTFQPVSAQTACLPATAGHFVDTEGAVAETACAAGTFQPLSGQYECRQAAPGHFVDTAGAAEETVCSKGYFQPASGADSCLAAPVGAYVDTLGATVAITCPAGTTTENSASTSAGDCVPDSPEGDSVSALVDALRADVADLVNQGTLARFRGYFLIGALNRAERRYNLGYERLARRDMRLFIGLVNVYEYRGLPAETADSLRAQAAAIIAKIAEG